MRSCDTDKPIYCKGSEITNSNGTYFTKVKSGQNLILNDITFTDSDGKVLKVPAMRDITATPCEESEVQVLLLIGTANDSII